MKEKPLTSPQTELLESIKENAVHVVEYYSPAKALVKKGLATWETIGTQTKLKITDAGKMALTTHGS